MMEDLSLHILDLAENAISAGAGRIEIVVNENERRDLLTVRVTDDGRGMTAEEADRALDPFFTTKRKRTGLGLALLSPDGRPLRRDRGHRIRPAERDEGHGPVPPRSPRQAAPDQDGGDDDDVGLRAPGDRFPVPPPAERPGLRLREQAFLRRGRRCSSLGAGADRTGPESAPGGPEADRGVIAEWGGPGMPEDLFETGILTSNI